MASFDGICGEKTLTLEPREEVVYPEFIPFLFHSESFYRHSTEAIIGSTNPHVRWRDVANYKFLLPPKDQQTKLARLLWAMDTVIEKERVVLEKLNSSYITLIEKDLLNKNSEKIFFNELLEVIRGVGFKPNQLIDNYNDKACIILRSNNISDSKINYDDLKILPIELIKKNQILCSGDFAICMSNGSKELVGKCAEYFDNLKNVSIGSFCAGLRPRNNRNGQILRHLLNSESYRYAIKRILSGSAINNLKPSDIENLFLRVDGEQLKTSLLDILDKMLSNKFSIESKIASSKSLQKSLINQIF